MLRFSAAGFVIVTHNLELARNMLLVAEYQEQKVDLKWDVIEKSLEEVEREVKELPLSESLQAQVHRAITHAKRRDPGGVSHLLVVLGEISHNIVNELASHLFFFVRSELKWYYLTPEEVIGPAFESTFPDAIKDAHSGIRCFVLDQWTASVFHFMRVLEHGLRWLSEKAGLDIKDISLENWKSIIDQIVKKINEMEQLPKSQQKSENIKFYSEAAANFRFFKDAWRNHVSHARVTYDSDDARRIMDHVVEFMKHLASRD